MRRILINCDLGEGQPYDERLMPMIDSCSIACGGHFGDEKSMRKSILLAMEHDVNIGAHPSFPDRMNFGRKPYTFTKDNTDNLDYIDRKTLKLSLIKQVHDFKSITEDCGGKVHHVKAHGALYNLIATQQDFAEFYMELLEELSLDVYVYTPWDAHLVALAAQAKSSISLKKEAFADRRYDVTGRLVPRSHEKALIEDPKSAWDQVLSIYRDQKLQSIDNHWIECHADTFCVHGDSENALNIVAHIREQVSKANIDPNS